MGGITGGHPLPAAALRRVNQVNNAGKNPAVYLLLKKVYSGFSDGSRSENRLLAEVKKQLEEDECNNALLLLDGYNELPSITCQMHFILDIASYQEQYPNSTIVVASRTKCSMLMHMLL